MREEFSCEATGGGRASGALFSMLKSTRCSSRLHASSPTPGFQPLAPSTRHITHSHALAGRSFKSTHFVQQFSYRSPHGHIKLSRGAHARRDTDVPTLVYELRAAVNGHAHVRPRVARQLQPFDHHQLAENVVERIPLVGALLLVRESVEDLPFERTREREDRERPARAPASWRGRVARLASLARGVAPRGVAPRGVAPRGTAQRTCTLCRKSEETSSETPSHLVT